jgi:hypothetical protein
VKANKTPASKDLDHQSSVTISTTITKDLDNHQQRHRSDDHQGDHQGQCNNGPQDSQDKNQQDSFDQTKTTTDKYFTNTNDISKLEPCSDPDARRMCLPAREADTTHDGGQTQDATKKASDAKDKHHPEMNEEVYYNFTFSFQ